jgi:hypothetical protein
MTSPEFRLRLSAAQDARAVNLSSVPAVAHDDFRQFGLSHGRRPEVLPAHAWSQDLFRARAAAR